MSDYEQVEEVKVSKFNSAGLINIRLHELWIDSNKHKRNGQFNKWNGDLDSVWCELVGDVKEKDDNDKNFKTINEELGKEGFLSNVGSSSSGFNKVKKSFLRKRARQYLILLKKESLLRRLQNKQGKGTAYEDGSSDYME